MGKGQALSGKKGEQQQQGKGQRLKLSHWSLQVEHQPDGSSVTHPLTAASAATKAAPASASGLSGLEVIGLGEGGRAAGVRDLLLPASEEWRLSQWLEGRGGGERGVAGRGGAYDPHTGRGGESEQQKGTGAGARASASARASVSAQRLQELAERVEQWYRARGFVLAKVKGFESKREGEEGGSAREAWRCKVMEGDVSK